ncbi:SH3 domain-containing protein [Leptolyngbya ohadii]|uniref:SH3 domain-containing protein n=1 Tax=Leptolyngbya ohadii TaxID=1962290 RepID=UPI001CED0A3F|nr:SH3 domain-containing protein [Leptolyngbya ohadii]
MSPAPRMPQKLQSKNRLAFLWTVSLLLSLPLSALADTAVPVDRLRSQLQGRTQVPIVLPNQLPEADALYSNVASVSPGGYEISFTYTPDCQGTACTWGYFSAQRGGTIDTQPISPRDTIESVTLANGTQAQFTNFCGAYCTAQASWISQGVLYSASVKNGRRETVVALANSALQAVRPTSNPSAPNNATLTSRDPGSRINIRDRASTNSPTRHYGLAGDAVRVLEQVTGSDRQPWYRVQFVGSGAAGWVRGDFIRF